MKSTFLKIILFALMGQLANARVSTISIGSIERNSGGRSYAIGLTSSEVKEIKLYSRSEDQDAKIKLYSAIYYNGIFTVNLSEEEKFTSSYPSDISFNLEDLAQYSILTTNPDCMGPCLLVRAEAFGADDLKLNIEIEGLYSDVSIWSTGVTGLAARSETRNNDPAEGSAQNRRLFARMNNYVLFFEKAGTNPDGSSNYKNLTISSGPETYFLGQSNYFYNDDDQTRYGICKLISLELENSQTSAIAFTEKEIGLNDRVVGLKDNQRDFYKLSSRYVNIRRIDTITCR
jgi:hypothetical protein